MENRKNREKRSKTTQRANGKVQNGNKRGKDQGKRLKDSVSVGVRRESARSDDIKGAEVTTLMVLLCCRLLQHGSTFIQTPARSVKASGLAVLRFY